VISVKNYHENMRCIVQLMMNKNKVFIFLSFERRRFFKKWHTCFYCLDCYKNRLVKIGL